MRCLETSFLCYFMPKSSTNIVNLIMFLLCLHSPGLMGSGLYLNGCRCYLRDVC